MKKQQNKIAGEKLLGFGDVDFVQLHKISNKVAPHFEGPYNVISYEYRN